MCFNKIGIYRSHLHTFGHKFPLTCELIPVETPHIAVTITEHFNLRGQRQMSILCIRKVDRFDAEKKVKSSSKKVILSYPFSFSHPLSPVAFIPPSFPLSEHSLSASQTIMEVTCNAYK